MSTNERQSKQSSARGKIIVAVVIVAIIGAALAAHFLLPGHNAGTGEANVVVVLPLSGKGAAHGEYVRDGLQMFQRAYPASPLHVTIVDSESDPQKAVSGFKQQLLLQKPVAAISVLSGVSDALAPIAEENKVLLIGVNTATNTFVQNYTQTQRINDRPADHTAPIARVMAKKFTRVGVIHADDSFGQFCKTTFESEFHQLNSNDIIVEPFSSTERDQNIVVQRLLAKQPEAVFVAGYGQGYISIFQTLRTFDYAGMVFADIDFSNPQVLASLGEAAEGVVFAAMDFNVSPPPTKEAADFLKSYQERFNREPWLGSAFAYDALAIFDHLYQTKEPMTRESVFALKEWPGIAAPLSFPTPGECQYVFQFVQRVKGENVPVDLDKVVS